MNEVKKEILLLEFIIESLKATKCNYITKHSSLKIILIVL